MLGCFVGPGGAAARGVPDRFLGIVTKSGEAAEKGKENENENEKEKEKEKKLESGAAGDSKADPMDVDAK